MEFGCVTNVPDEYAASIFRVKVIGMKIQSGYKSKVTGYYYQITFTLKMETLAAQRVATGYHDTDLLHCHVSVCNYCHVH